MCWALIPNWQLFMFTVWSSSLMRLSDFEHPRFMTRTHIFSKQINLFLLVLTHWSYFPSSSSASGWSRWSGTSVTFSWQRCWDSSPCCVWEYPPAPPCPPSSSPSPCGWPARNSWATSTTTVSVWASATVHNRPSRHIGRLTDRTESSAKKFIPVNACSVAFYC